MRSNLKRINEKRMVFQGVFERYGLKSNWHGFPVKTILLKDVRDSSSRVVTNHLWFNYTKGFQALGDMEAGDVIEFNARVKEYVKGYINNRRYIDERTIDYKLSHPTKIRKKQKHAND